MSAAAQSPGVEDLAPAGQAQSAGSHAVAERRTNGSVAAAKADGGGKSAKAGGAVSPVFQCSHHLSDEQRRLIEKLRQQLKEEFGHRDVDLYLEDEDMIRRYLKGHSWNYETARGYLSRSLAWREKVPRPASWDCSYCINNPGYHCMRQVSCEL